METKIFRRTSSVGGLLLLVIIISVFTLLVPTVFASAERCGGGGKFNGGPGDWCCSDPDYLALTCIDKVTFPNVLKSIFALAGVVSFVFLIKGGIQYTTAGGDSKAVDSAKKTLTGAMIGLGLAIGSYFIIQLISQTFGADILKFVIPPPA